MHMYKIMHHKVYINRILVVLNMKCPSHSWRGSKSQLHESYLVSRVFFSNGCYQPYGGHVLDVTLGNGNGLLN